MVVAEYEGKSILCISPKGIAAADQYLINKFFSYSQVIFNKHTIALEWMAKQIVSWMQENDKHFPRKDTLRTKWIKDNDDKYLYFTDNYFWSSIKSVTDDHDNQKHPQYIIRLCEMLLRHEEIRFVNNSEYKIVSKVANDIIEFLKSSKFYQENGKWKDKITVLCKHEMTKHIPYNDYIPKLKMPGETDEHVSDEEFEAYKKNMNALRLIDGICVFSEGVELHLLCDDERSLMQQLCQTQLVVMRSYEFAHKGDRSEERRVGQECR